MCSVVVEVWFWDIMIEILQVNDFECHICSLFYIMNTVQSVTAVLSRCVDLCKCHSRPEVGLWMQQCSFDYCCQYFGTAKASYTMHIKSLKWLPSLLKDNNATSLKWLLSNKKTKNKRHLYVSIDMTPTLLWIVSTYWMHHCLKLKRLLLILWHKWWIDKSVPVCTNCHKMTKVWENYQRLCTVP